MGLITSSTYLAVFASGTIIGATSMYLLSKIKPSYREVPLEERYQFPELNDEYRLIMAIRNDLKMQKGKVAAQCGHASVTAYRKTLECDPTLLKRWLQFGGTKITVKVDSEEELLELEKAANDVKILASIVRDAGQTQVAPGSRTVIAIGPAPKSALDKITGHLKLY